MVVIMVIATAVYSSTNAIYASKLKVIIDEGFINNDMGAIYATIAILVVVTLFRGIGFFISNYAMRRISSDIVLVIRKEMFSHLQRLPSRYFDRVNTGKTLSRFNYDVLQVTDAATNAVITLVREGILVIVLLSYLFYQNWKLTLLIFALAPIIGLVVRVISKRLRKLAQRIQGNMGNMNHVLDENIKGQRIIKVYAGQAHETKKFNRSVEQIRNASIKSEVATSASTPIIELMIVCVISLIIWLLAREAKFGNLTPGEFLSYTIMMGLLPSPIKKLMRINEFVQRGLVASQEIFNFLDEETETTHVIANGNADMAVPRFSGELQFKHVAFSYADELILNDFNLHIAAGETVALVGPSGSGKSSLAALIPRFYDINAGQITLDNIDLSDMDLNILRQQIAFVSQDTVLFDDTVTNNIAYGSTPQTINMERVKRSAQLAQAESFILEMDGGYNSYIGEAGQRLSGGQKQRLAIARALYKDAPILILDEATSALDSESENLVQMALDELLKHRTAIVIAHRLSTVKNADRILVLDQGRIVESGTHEALIRAKGRYYYLNQSLASEKS
ncbi:MAG: lipid A export permease/ATP-binding protein MsbA [Gammaproteobacteria bacterium]|nr:MAG: lipid A export permease/ATP-binding protein MsbA [Gammaproteobacteria bacterium]